jgi:outer membrane lipoprotein-sorting protein
VLVGDYLTQSRWIIESKFKDTEFTPIVKSGDIVWIYRDDSSTTLKTYLSRCAGTTDAHAVPTDAAEWVINIA